MLSNATEIKNAATKDLVSFYNKLTGKSIKKFESREIAEKRCTSLLNIYSPSIVAEVERQVQAESTVTFGDGTQLTFTEEDVTKVAPGATKGVKMPRQQSSGPRATGLPGPHSSLAGKRLYKKVEANPRRAGTHGFTSFALIKDGMTYEEYRLAGGRSNDLAWDIAHGFVEVK